MFSKKQPRKNSNGSVLPVGHSRTEYTYVGFRVQVRAPANKIRGIFAVAALDDLLRYSGAASFRQWRTGTRRSQRLSTGHSHSRVTRTFGFAHPRDACLLILPQRILR